MAQHAAAQHVIALAQFGERRLEEAGGVSDDVRIDLDFLRAQCGPCEIGWGANGAGESSRLDEALRCLLQPQHPEVGLTDQILEDPQRAYTQLLVGAQL